MKLICFTLIFSLHIILYLVQAGIRPCINHVYLYDILLRMISADNHGIFQKLDSSKLH